MFVAAEKLSDNMDITRAS